MGVWRRKQQTAASTNEIPSYDIFTRPFPPESGRDLSYYQFSALPFGTWTWPSGAYSSPSAAPEADGFRTALAVAAAIGHIERGEYAEALDVLRKIQQLPSPNGVVLRRTVEDHQYRGVPSLVRAAELYGPAAVQRPDPSTSSIPSTLSTLSTPSTPSIPSMRKP